MTWLIALTLFFGSQTPAPAMPAGYQAVLTTLGRAGDFKDGVLRVGLPRADLAVTIKGRAVPTALGFGGWIAVTPGMDGMSVLMGDLVLTEDQVDGVLSAVLDQGLDASAIHNHFFWESPRIFYVHVHGMGTPADLARKIKPALDLTMRGMTGPAPAPPALGLDGAAVSAIVGAPGDAAGGVYKITIGRSDFVMREMGATINARMGLNTWAAFAGTTERAVVAGDVAMLANEVTPVLTAMRKAGLSIVSLHHHMVATTPDVYFLHYWGEGPATSLAAGVKAALDQLRK